MDGELLNHLWLADDVTLIANTKEELQEILMEVNNKPLEIGPKINFIKTNILTTKVKTTARNYSERIGKVQTFIYLGQKNLNIKK